MRCSPQVAIAAKADLVQSFFQFCKVKSTQSRPKPEFFLMASRGCLPGLQKVARLYRNGHSLFWCITSDLPFPDEFMDSSSIRNLFRTKLIANNLRQPLANRSGNSHFSLLSAGWKDLAGWSLGMSKRKKQVNIFGSHKHISSPW